MHNWPAGSAGGCRARWTPKRRSAAAGATSEYLSSGSTMRACPGRNGKRSRHWQIACMVRDRMARTGRRRRAGKREPGGRLQRRATRDQGTPEGQARRKVLYRHGDIGYPLGILHANGEISAGDLKGCERYGFLHYAVFGRRSVASVNYDGERLGTGRKNWTDKFIKDTENEYRRVRAEICSTKSLALLDNLVVYERMPRWFRPLTPHPKDVENGQQLLKAIRMLAIITGYEVLQDA